MRTQHSDIKTTGSAHSRALVILTPSARMRLVPANPKAALRQSAWGLQYGSERRVQRAAATPAIDRFRFPGRLAMAVGEVMEILIATSGTLVVVLILLAMAMMVRAIRTLLHR